MSTLSTQNQSKWDQVLALYGEGASDVEVCKHLNMTMTQFDKTYADVEAFAKIIDWGRTLGKAWWYETLRKNVKNKSFNTALFNFAMKNLYGWADKVETKDVDTVNQSADQQRAELQAIIKRISDKDPSLLRLVVGGKEE